MRQGGFTLTEVMVSVLLFAIAMGAMFSLSSALIRINAFSRETKAATALAEDKIEDFVGRGMAEVVSGSDTVARFSRTWTVATNAMPGGKAVTVTVKWKDIDGKSHRAQLATIVTP